MYLIGTFALLLLFGKSLGGVVGERKDAMQLLLKRNLKTWDDEADYKPSEDAKNSNNYLPEILQPESKNQDKVKLLLETLELLGGSSSCINITEDLGNLTATILYGYQTMDGLFEELVQIIQGLNQCGNDGPFSQIACYLKEFKEIQKAIKIYSVAVDQMLLNLTASLQRLEHDLRSCFSHSSEVDFPDWGNKGLHFMEKKED